MTVNAAPLLERVRAVSRSVMFVRGRHQALAHKVPLPQFALPPLALGLPLAQSRWRTHCCRTGCCTCALLGGGLLLQAGGVRAVCGVCMRMPPLALRCRCHMGLWLWRVCIVRCAMRQRSPLYPRPCSRVYVYTIYIMLCIAPLVHNTAQRMRSALENFDKRHALCAF